MKPSNYLFLLSLIFLFACNNSGNRADYAPEAYSGERAELARMDYDDFQEKPDQTATPAVDRKIIRTAGYRIQVKDVKSSTQKAIAYAEALGGYVTDQNETNSNYSIDAYLTIRVPGDQLDTLIRLISGEALFTNYKRIQARDVTEEYLDVTTRLENKKAVRDRYVDILRNKAQTVEDILEAEEKIRIIQEEIEVQEGRLKYLNSQVAFSTLNLELYQKVDYQPEPSIVRESYWTRLLDSLEGGWHFLVDLSLFLIRIWPLLLIAILIWWQRRRLLFWRKK